VTLDSDIWVGDLVKGLNALAPATDLTRDVLAALLGLTGPASVSTEVGRELDTLTLDERQRSASTNEAGVESWADSTEGVRVEAQAQTPNAAESIQEVLSPVRTESIPAAKKASSIPALEPPDFQELATQPVHEPLFDPRWQREVAVAATAQLLPLGLIDVRALVARAARGLPVLHLPRCGRWSVSRGAQLLIDGSRGMEPYRNDQAAFASVVKSVVGPERVEVVEFENAPLRGVYGSDDIVRRPYRSPGPEVPVLLLTDFGLGGPIDDTARATADEWQDFAAAARTSARILAIVPYLPERVPVRVRRNIHALHWNRPTAHRHIREALRSVTEATAAGSAVTRAATPNLWALASELAALVSPAVFIEPELLRAMRLELMPLSGPETEAAVWFGPFVRARNAAGIVLHRRAADVLRERLRVSWNEQPTIRPRLERACDIIAQVHRGQSSALRLEERLAWRVITGDLAGAERELKRALNAYAQGGRPGIASWAAQAWGRLPSQARNTPTGWRFHQLARARRGHRQLTAVDMPATLSADEIVAAVEMVENVKFGLRRRGGTLELGNLSGEGAVAIMVPDLEPRRVDLLDEAGSTRVEITVRSHERAELDVSDQALTIRTLRGQVYRLPPVSSVTHDAPRTTTAQPSAGRRPETSWGGAWPSWELFFSERGRVMDEAFIGGLTAEVPNDIFVLVHGWNNDRAEARWLYAHLLKEMQNVADGGIVSGRRLGALGVFWPSKLWPDDDSQLTGASAVELEDALGGSQLRDLEERINPEQRRSLGESVRRLEEHPDDPRALEEMRALSRDLDPDGDKVRRTGVSQSEEGASGLFGGIWQGSKNALRMMTYYTMRRRAGIVGQNGLGPFFRRLAAAAPASRVHLIAHSVGARVAAYGLNGLSPTNTSPVKSFVILQGILPAYAFASSLPSNPDRPGALAHAIRNVDGPVIVTYSTHDRASGLLYEVLSRLASGDDDAPGERASKALGHDGAKGVSAVTASLGPSLTAYAFRPGQLVNVDASSVIRDHSDVASREIGWLILSAAGVVRPNFAA
jgi:hypothetical protein